MHPSITALWQRYRQIEPTACRTLPPVEYFCDNAREADLCAMLVATRRKRATSSALADYERAGEALPEAGKLTIVTDWAGHAKALIRTGHVTIRRFGDVTASFAALEGEGDGTLESWRTLHRAFWARASGGSPPSDDFQVVCEEFDLVLAASDETDHEKAAALRSS